MITNKDIRVEAGNLVLNGDKYPLDGQSPEAIMAIVEDNSDTTPSENSDAPITSGGVFTALGTKQDTLTFDTVPTDESTNPVESGGVYTALSGKRSLTPGTAAAAEVDISTAIGSTNAYTTPHEGFVRVRGNSSGETYLYIFDKLAYIIPNFNSLISIWLPKGVPMYFDDQHYAPGLAQWFSCSNE